MKNLDIFIGWLTELKNYAEGQAPDVINQLISYTLYIDKLFLWIFSGVVILSFVIIVLDATCFGNYGPSPLSFISAILILFCFIGWSITFCEITQIEKAPKVFVLEYIAKQIKDNK